MHDINCPDDRPDYTVDTRRAGALIVLRKGRSAPQAGIAAADVGDVDRLERFVASCPDVRSFRFDALDIHVDDGSQVRKVGVHAVVECLSRTWLVNVHEDGSDAFRATCYLKAAARQLGFLHRVVTPMAVACSSARFATLIGVALSQHDELDPADVTAIADVIARVRQPCLADIRQALGAGSRGRTRALAAVAHGHLHLEPHAVLSSSVRVRPGPMLDHAARPSGAVANDRAGDRDGEAA
ncbi:hypothetical protein [Sphingomonas sp. Ant20]|jgi:hypothetical protein|uniref:hypothetical protein n=1 Tax=Sphingomonas sp. Ant20 TaxID=104605 RepID=UPI0005386D0A|nr:hypothetical protein [Sphingomonas sp. Ant20]KHA63117.1 hypothetical protein NI18_18480 [Sphingomonas sp. Ant20]